ncbi:MAG: glycosyl transferase family protein [Rhodospirillales bacterium]
MSIIDRDEHPFAPFLRIVAKGRTLGRALDRAEAADAMRLILEDKVEPMQLGAFLLVLRYREETPGELAGFVDAARAYVAADASLPVPDLDWPSYADRHRQQPWFVLAALLLAANGIKVLMHGIDGYHDGPGGGMAPTRPVLRALGIEPSASLAEGARRMADHGFAYVGTEQFLPAVEKMFHLRPVLGLRTLVNTYARAVNPLAARAQMQGVVHPPYRGLHRETAVLLGQSDAAIFKGGGGEAQRNPLKPCEIFAIRDGDAVDITFPAFLRDVSHDWRSESLEPERVAALWRGELTDPAPEAAVVATAALGLWLTGRAGSAAEADEMADTLWRDRPRERFAA